MPLKIVQLSPTVSVAPQINAADIAAIAAQGFRTLINNRPDDEEPGQFSSTEARRGADSVGLDYRYQPVTTSKITRADIEAFDRLLAETEGPVLAQCRSGTRCYILWAGAQVINGRASADTLIAEAAERGFDISALARLL